MTTLMQAISNIRLMLKLVYFSNSKNVNLGVKQDRFLAVFPLNVPTIPDPRLLMFSPVHMVERLLQSFSLF